MAYIRRLNKDLKEMELNPLVNCSAHPIQEDNILNWHGFILGPPGSPYEGGYFYLKIDFPMEYPFRPPRIKFETPIYHPNIAENGNASLDILHLDNWAPKLTLSNILAHLSALLEKNEIDKPLKEKNELFNKTAKEWTQKYAME